MLVCQIRQMSELIQTLEKKARIDELSAISAYNYKEVAVERDGKIVPIAARLAHLKENI